MVTSMWIGGCAGGDYSLLDHLPLVPASVIIRSLWLSWVFPQSSLSVMTPMTGAVLGAIAFLVAGLCIAASTKVVPGE